MYLHASLSVLILVLLVGPKVLICEKIEFIENGEPDRILAQEYQSQKIEVPAPHPRQGSYSFHSRSLRQIQQIGPADEHNRDRDPLNKNIIMERIIAITTENNLASSSGSSSVKPDSKLSTTTQLIFITPDFRNFTFHFNPNIPIWTPPTRVFNSVLGDDGQAGGISDEEFSKWVDAMDASCPRCHEIFAEHHELQHPLHRSNMEDTYGRTCTEENQTEICVHMAYFYCKENTKTKVSQCECLPRMERAKIVVGKFKGTTWCLVKDNMACVDRDSKDEDCASGRCEESNLCAKSDSSARGQMFERRFKSDIILFAILVAGTLL